MINNFNLLKLTRPHRFQKPVRSLFLMVLFLVFQISIQAQNKSEEAISAKGIYSIRVNGNDIFKINVETSETENIIIKSLNDGEYQNYYAVSTKIKLGQLNIALNQIPFTTIPDDKRNAHKVVAATLSVKIPKNLNVSIISDIGSVDVIGKFKNLTVELKNGSCKVDGTADLAVINTFSGDINIATIKANINAESNNGKVKLTEFDLADSFWKIQSINGNITVAKKE